MELQRVVEDLLLSSSNESYHKKALIASHIISDKFLDINDPTNRNFIKGTEMSYPNLSVFKEASIVTIVDRVIDVYIFPKENVTKQTKNVLNILGYNCVNKNMSKALVKKQMLDKKDEYSFLQDSEYKIIYFPFHPVGEEEDFHIFREVGKNSFLIDSLSSNLSNKGLNIKDGFTRKDIIDMILDELYNGEES